MDMEEFKERLNSGHYPVIGSARKAVGRVKGWSNKLREEASALAEKHFEGAPSKPATAKKAKKAAAAAAPKAEKVPGKRGRKPGRKPRSESAPAAERAEAVPRAQSHQRPDFSHIETAIGILHKGLDVAMVSKNLGPESATIAQAAERTNQALIRCADEVVAIIQRFSVLPEKVDPRFAQAVIASSPGNPKVVDNGGIATPFVGPPIVPPTVPTQG